MTPPSPPSGASAGEPAALPAPADIPTPRLPPIVRHDGRGRPIEISGGRLDTLAAQLRFLGDLTRAVHLNLVSQGQGERS